MCVLHHNLTFCTSLLSLTLTQAGPSRDTARKNSLRKEKRRLRSTQAGSNEANQNRTSVSIHPKHLKRGKFYKTTVNTSVHLKRTKPAFKGKRAIVGDVLETFEGLEEIRYVPSRPG